MVQCPPVVVAERFRQKRRCHLFTCKRGMQFSGTEPQRANANDGIADDIPDAIRSSYAAQLQRMPLFA